MMYFFCDIDGLEPQEVGRNFGPCLPDFNNNYRVTSIHKINPTYPKAIAVVDGEIFITPDKDSPEDQVSLVLKPHLQPTEENLPAVKYYIYKGIKKSSFISGGQISSPSNNDLTKSIWNSQRQRNISYDISKGFPEGTTNDENSPPLTNAILWEIGDPLLSGNIVDTTPIYKIFFRDDSSDSQQNRVKAGWHIGDFISDPEEEIGFEIICDQIGFEPNFGFIQKKENIISTLPLPIDFDDADYFSYWNDKEFVLNFLDPCAFYGSFWDSKLSAIKGNLNVTFNSKNEIYEEFLNDHFLNKNKIYVDIRTGLNYSYNYNKNYSGFNPSELDKNIYFEGDDSKTDPTALGAFNEVNYDKFGNYEWPIFVITVDDLVVGTVEENILIQFAFPRMDTPNPIVVLIQGSFFLDKQFKLFNRNKANYKILNFPLNDNITESLQILSPNYKENELVEPVSCYLRIKYIKEAPQCIEENCIIELQNLPKSTTLRAYSDLENIFTPFDMILPWSDPDLIDSNKPNGSWVTHNEIYADVVRSSGQSFIADSGIARDGNGDITLFAFSTNKVITNKLIGKKKFSLVGKKRKVGDQRFLERISSEFNLKAYKIQIDLGDPETDPFVEFLGNIGEEELNSFGNYDPDDFAFITIPSEDFKRMQDIIEGEIFDYPTAFYPKKPFLSGYKVHLGIKLIVSGAVQTVRGVPYDKFEFILRGYSYADYGNDPTKIEVREIETGINYYRLRKELPSATSLTAVGALEEGETPITILGRAYDIEDIGSTVHIPFPDGTFPVDPIPIKKINCKVYIYRGQGVTPDQFCDYLNYWRANVQQVWNTTSNKGLATTYDPFPEPGEPHWKRPFIVDGSGIEVREASIIQLSLLKDNEILLFLTGGGGRSYINNSTIPAQDRRTGEFFYIPQGTNPYYEAVENVPAHEFGHVLGLEDRYVYKVFNEENFIPVTQGKASLMTPANSPAIPTAIYLPSMEDENFCQRYNWLHNLMSTTLNVKYTDDPNVTPIESESTYLHFHNFLRPEPDVNKENCIDYSKVTVHITEKQFRDIIDKKRSKIKSIVFIKKYNPAQTFDGSFIGFEDIGSGEFKYYSDDSIVSSINPALNFQTYHVREIRPAEDFNDFDHRMQERAKIYPGNPSDDSLRETIKGHFEPDLEGFNPAIKGPLNDLSLRDVTSPFPTQTTYFDLEFGGNLYETLGINRFRNDILTIYNVSRINWPGKPINYVPIPSDGFVVCNSVLPGSDPTIPSPSPCVPVNFRELIQKLNEDIENNEAANIMTASFTSDQFSNAGSGNTYGMDVWNAFIKNTDIPHSPSDQINIFFKQLESTFNVGMFSGPVGSLGNSPYFDSVFDLDCNSPLDNNNIRAYKKYILVFNIYLNRRIILRSIQGSPLPR